jgi:sugar/nucleoside kinase (ribokinase family)
VEARSPIGAGDAFASGLGLRLEAGAPLDRAVAFAVAVAAAHVESPNGELDRDRVAELEASPAAPAGAGI